MNFTKYAAALALFATAAFATEQPAPEKASSEPAKAEVKLTTEDLSSAMTKCAAEEHKKDLAAYTKCMKENKIEAAHIVKAAFENKNEVGKLTSEELKAILETVEPSSYSTTTIVLLCAGSVVVLGAIAGGIYMATRKSSETDL